jgi:integrase
LLSPGTRKDVRNVLRAALTCAVEEQIITRNPAAVIRLPARSNPGRKARPCSADEARQFLESARNDDDGLYAAYVLLLVLGLRKGELLGLTWEMVSLDNAELYVGEQLQRVGRQLLRRPTKTEGSEAPLPLPDLCIAALKLRRQQQDTDRDNARDGWVQTGLVFTTRRCWPPSTCTRAWPYRSSSTARSPSRWRSTPKSYRRRHATRSGNSATSSATEPPLLHLLLHQHAKRPVSMSGTGL